MITTLQGEIIVELVRKHGKMLRGGTYASDRRRRMLGLPTDDWSEKIRFGNASWRQPKPARRLMVGDRD